MPNRRRRWKTVLAVLPLLLPILLIAWAAPAEAHKVYLFAWVEGDRVVCDAYYSRSRKVIGGTIRVEDENGRLLTEGTTDDQGGFSFEIPEVTNLYLSVDAGSGHRGEYFLSAEELPGGPAGSVSSEPAPVAAPESDAVQTGAPPTEAPAVGLSADEVRAVVDQALEAQLRPLIRSLAEMREESENPSLKDIFGGLGWIAGIAGLIMYFQSKKKSK